MARPHYSSDELLAYLDQNDEVVNRDEVTRHLSACATCSSLLRGVEASYALLSDPALWADSLRAEISAPERRPRGLAAFTAAKRRFEAETAQAEVTFAELQQQPLESWVEYMALHGSTCGDALVRRVVLAAREGEERAPREALQLLATAEMMAGLVSDLSLETVGELWKERANTQMVLGDYPSALVSWDEAERAYACGSVIGFDVAFVAWGRASVYFEMGDYQAALPLARSARRTFRRFGDGVRVAQVQVLEACILHEQGDLARAQRIYDALVTVLEGMGDEITLARVLANIACCKLQRDELVDAETYAKRATAIYAKYGLETEITRTRWALAKALLRQGDFEEGAKALERVAAEFEASGLTTDAAEVRLDIVEDLLRRENYGRAAALARDLVTTFARARAQLSVVKALTYLREATDSRRATPQLVRAVRHVLIHPGQPFAPPGECLS